MNARPSVELDLNSLVERLKRDDLTRKLPINESEIGLKHYTVRWSCNDVDQIIRCKIELVYFENNQEQDLQKVITVFTGVLEQLGFLKNDKNALNDFNRAVSNYKGDTLACGRVALGELRHNYVTISVSFNKEDNRLLNNVMTLDELDKLDKTEAARRSPVSVVRDNSPSPSFSWSCLFCCPNKKDKPAILQLTGRDNESENEPEEGFYLNLNKQ